MNTISQRTVSYFIAACLMLLPTITVRAADPDFSAIAPRMQQFVDKGEISGIVTLVATKDKILHLAAVGTTDIATGRKVQTDDIFWIASMTKPMCSAAAAMLIEEGKLAYDDPVEKFIPEFHTIKVGRNSDPLARPITLRDLLTHTSGLAEYTTTDPHWTLEQFSKQIATQPSRFQPGTRWQYSTAGIDAVSRIIEVAGGMPFADFMQKRLFDPLGMKNSTFWISAEQEKRNAHTYRLNAQTGKLEEAPITYIYGGAVTDRQRPAMGGAGLFSTAEDILRFYQMMLNGGTANGHALLKPQTVAQMTQNQIGTFTARPGEPWGYAIAVVADPAAEAANTMLSPGSYGHGGAFGTNSWVDPKRGLIYIILLERAALRDPDNNDMRVAFQQLAAQATANMTSP